MIQLHKGTKTFMSSTKDKYHKLDNGKALELSSYDASPSTHPLPGEQTHAKNELDIDNDDFEMNTGESFKWADGDSNEYLDSHNSRSSFLMGFMNMSNSIIGAGCIGLPMAIKYCGIVGGVLVLVFSTLLVDFTLRLVVVNLKLSGTSTYQDSVEAAMGKWGKLLILLGNSFFAIGGCIGFCIIIGDTIPHVLKAFFPSHASIFHRNIIIVLITIFISYPLSLNRDISKLAKTSLLALLSMGLILISVIIRGPLTDSSYKGEFVFPNYLISSKLLQGMSIINFAMICHHNTSMIFSSLRKPTLKRFDTLTHLCCGIAMVVCALMGFTGFAIFRDKTKGNILNNFPSDDKLINVARFCFGFNMLTTYPMEVFVFRECIRDLIFFKNYDLREPPVLSKKLHFLITTVIVLVTMSISLTTCNLGATLEIVGSTSGSLMAFILPPWVNLIFTGKEKPPKEKIKYYFTIGVGIFLMIFSSLQTLIDAMKGSADSHCSA